MVITIVLLSILLVISIYVNINLTKKFEKIEEMAENSVDILLENEKLLTSLKNRLLSQQSYLRQLDRIGAFEADDETGYFFKELKSIINDISLYFGESIPENESDNIFENDNFKAKLEKNDTYEPNKIQYKKDYYL
jgi:competence protein ComGC